MRTDALTPLCGGLNWFKGLLLLFFNKVGIVLCIAFRLELGFRLSLTAGSTGSKGCSSSPAIRRRNLLMFSFEVRFLPQRLASLIVLFGEIGIILFC